jgi:hypothetical protein
MPIILSTWEAKIRMIAVQDQPRQIAHETPSQPTASVVEHTCHPKLHKRLRLRESQF